MDYCEETFQCRRVIALAYFDEIFNKELCDKMCDNCTKNIDIEEQDVTHDAKKILEFLRYMNLKKFEVTMSQVIDILKTGKRDKIKKFSSFEESYLGCLRHLQIDHLKKIMRRLIIIKALDEYLVSQDKNIWSNIVLSNLGYTFLSDMNLKITITSPVTQCKEFKPAVNKVEKDKEAKLNKTPSYLKKKPEKDLN
jgi:superfamily II DNA helicase RecQ